MLGRRALLVASLAAAVLPRRAWAAGPLDELLARIARARAPLRTMQGPFVQTRTLGLLATDVRSTGTLVLVRPDRLRWELAPPDAIVFFVGPEGLSYRGPHGEARMPGGNARVAAGLDDLRTLLAGDLARLRARWDLRLVRDDDTGAEIEATARPEAATQLKSIRFAVAHDLVRPTRAILVEGPHDRTVIEFGALVLDAPVDPARVRP
ncbi:MAG TPA: outer membrane lipoprotein carrier protein LolA [Polyangiaceae bacterium]